MHKRKTVAAYDIWKRIRGVNDFESKAEFFVMKASVDDEARVVAAKGAARRFIWMDFFT